MPESESDLQEILLDAEERMQKSLEALQKDFATIRSTRASPNMLDQIEAEYYGAMCPLNQLASVSVPEARILLIQPFDKSSLSAIEKAIQKSDLNLSPQNDGTVIRLILPELSMERRQELVKQVKQRLEEAKVAIRNVRRDANEVLKKSTGHSEDEIKAAQDEMQKVTDTYTGKAETIAEKKEESILTV